jgi:hypothetical protein
MSYEFAVRAPCAAHDACFWLSASVQVASPSSEGPAKGPRHTTPTALTPPSHRRPSFPTPPRTHAPHEGLLVNGIALPFNHAHAGRLPLQRGRLRGQSASDAQEPRGAHCGHAEQHGGASELPGRRCIVLHAKQHGVKGRGEGGGRTLAVFPSLARLWACFGGGVPARCRGQTRPQAQPPPHCVPFERFAWHTGDVHVVGLSHEEERSWEAAAVAMLHSVFGPPHAVLLCGQSFHIVLLGLCFVRQDGLYYKGYGPADQGILNKVRGPCSKTKHHRVPHVTE